MNDTETYLMATIIFVGLIIIAKVVDTYLKKRQADYMTRDLDFTDEGLILEIQDIRESIALALEQGEKERAEKLMIYLKKLISL